MKSEKRPLEAFHKAKCACFIQKLWEADTLSMFHHPVSATEVPNYYDVIKNPMDLSTIKDNIEKGVYSEDSDVEADVALMFTNALMFNEKDTPWYNLARELRKKYIRIAEECGLEFDADRAFIPTKKARDDESTIRKAEHKYKEEFSEVLRALEKEKEIPIEELRALYKRDSNALNIPSESSESEASDLSESSSSDSLSEETDDTANSSSGSEEDSSTK